ncbi:uncharacterized protein LOC132560648 [Ylistrum balloti]|uniref:uncharacterized protein LOC132560648 n=1 Tax=Ylistrum balloti TaxID=509963 RepID=UPI00290586CB|nr:uncharacterized protein LOC132560648 [Ylistrum balloti]
MVDFEIRNEIERAGVSSRDLEEGKQQNKQAMHDKMVAVAKAKDNVRNEMQAEFDKAKDKMTQDYQREIDKLTEIVRQQEEELRKLKTERIQWIHQDRQNSTVLDKLERTVVNEVNEECRRTSNVLGVGPRKVNIASFQGDSQIRTPTTSALEEMVQKIKEQLEKEKNMELERLKAKLAKGSQNELRETFIQNMPNNDLAASMQYSKPPKVPQYEFKPRSDLQQQEVDRLEREIKRLAMTMGRSPSPTPHQERMINFLAHRTKAAELESDMAAEQQERSRNMMSQKMGDMTKLQNTLTNQAKDLIQLSRAYSNLNTNYPVAR